MNEVEIEYLKHLLKKYGDWLYGNIDLTNNAELEFIAAQELMLEDIQYTLDNDLCRQEEC